jgi:hypothetical protein
MLVLALEFSRGGTAHATCRKLHGFGCERGDSAGDALIGTIGSAVSPGNGSMAAPSKRKSESPTRSQGPDPCRAGSDPQADQRRPDTGWCTDEPTSQCSTG